MNKENKKENKPKALNTYEWLHKIWTMEQDGAICIGRWCSAHCEIYESQRLIVEACGEDTKAFVVTVTDTRHQKYISEPIDADNGTSCILDAVGYTVQVGTDAGMFIGKLYLPTPVEPLEEEILQVLQEEHNEAPASIMPNIVLDDRDGFSREVAETRLSKYVRMPSTLEAAKMGVRYHELKTCRAGERARVLSTTVPWRGVVSFDLDLETNAMRPSDATDAKAQVQKLTATLALARGGKVVFQAVYYEYVVAPWRSGFHKYTHSRPYNAQAAKERKKHGSCVDKACTALREYLIRQEQHENS